jgi:hypothetical protein
MPLPAADSLQTVIFDAFGTLVQIGAWQSRLRLIGRAGKWIVCSTHGR